MKKGVSEFIFKAIFVTVAGALIMVFLFKFAFNQVDLFGRVDVRELVINLDHQLEALSVVPNSNRVLNLGRTYEVQFECDSIISKDFRREIEHIIFTQNYLKGDKLQSWTRTWEFPYKITNFFYLANDGTKFIFVYDKNNFDVVKNLNVPEIFNVQYFSSGKLDLKKIRDNSFGVPNIIFVLFTKNVNVNEIKKQIPNAKMISIDYANNNVRFYEKSLESFYLGDEMLIGAIFNSDDYECVKDRAIERLGLISGMYKSKASFLLSKEQRENCRNKLNSLITTLESFRKQKTKASLYETKKNIEKQNDDLEKNDCPTIY